MYCGKCGNQIYDGNLFCTVCGEKVNVKLNNKYFIKKHIEAFLSLGESMDNAFNSELKKISKLPAREILRFNLFQYCLFLSSADGVITTAETEFINWCLDYSYTPNELTRFVEENGIRDMSFQLEEPVSFLIMSIFDVEADVGGCEVLLDLYKKVGNVLIHVDEAKNEEMLNYSLYTTMLERFVQSSQEKKDSSEKS